MTEYEILLMLDPDLPEEKQGEVVGRVRTLIEKGGGTIERHDAWGRRRLAYGSTNKEEGVYHLCQLRVARPRRSTSCRAC